MHTVRGMTDTHIHLVLAARDDLDTQIVRLIAEGKTDKEIGGILFLAHQTVRNRVSRILAATEMMNRTQLAVMWLAESHHAA